MPGRSNISVGSNPNTTVHFEMIWPNLFYDSARNTHYIFNRPDKLYYIHTSGKKHLEIRGIVMDIRKKALHVLAGNEHYTLHRVSRPNIWSVLSTSGLTHFLGKSRKTT